MPAPHVAAVPTLIITAAVNYYREMLTFSDRSLLGELLIFQLYTISVLIMYMPAGKKQEKGSRFQYVPPSFLH